MKTAVLTEELRKIDITGDPEKWKFNETKVIAQSMVYGEPFPHFKSQEPYVIGPPRDKKTRKIDQELRDNGVVGVYLE